MDSASDSSRMRRRMRRRSTSSRLGPFDIMGGRLRHESPFLQSVKILQYRRTDNDTEGFPALCSVGAHSPPREEGNAPPLNTCIDRRYGGGASGHHTFFYSV